MGEECVRDGARLTYDEPGPFSNRSGIARTHTLMAFQHYSRHNLEGLFSIGLDTDPWPHS